MNRPIISVICPVYNEEKYITNILDFFIRAFPTNKEFILVDGGSTDQTTSLIKDYQRIYPNIKLLHNPQKYVPYALNMAIQACEGTYIARLDAHTFYPDDYFLQCLAAMEESGADNVGGYIHSIGEGGTGKAIAYAMSSTFGVGNSSFRTKIRDGFVETVPFGFWKRAVFEKFGYFDEELVRNQDDEFNYRIIKNGGKIFQSSKIQSKYFVRNSLPALYRQYFQYGLFKPLVIKKIGQVVKLRHLVPAMFVLYLFLVPLVVLFFPWSLIPLLMYILAACWASSKSGFSFAGCIKVVAVFFTLHFSYGLGFIRGFLFQEYRKLI